MISNLTLVMLSTSKEEYFQGRVLLATTNKIVDEVNDEMVEMIPGDLHTFHSIDIVEILTILPCSQLNFSTH